MSSLGTRGASDTWWSRWMIVRETLDHVSKTLTIWATDRLGNSLVEPLTVPVVFLYANLVEYVRVGVQLIYDEMNPPVVDARPAQLH